MTDVAPETVACSCGNGYAERRSRVVSNPGLRRRRRIVYNYRHAGCPFGGAIVVSCGHIVRKVGPVFNPDRYGQGDVAPASSDLPVAADGGGVGVVPE